MYYDIYILKDSGVCLFHQNFYDQKDRNLTADLVSGFFSSILLFASEFVDKKLEIIEIEYLKLIFLKKKGLIFVAFIDENESVSCVKSVLREISDIFFQIYDEILKESVFNTNLFKGFEKEIEMILTKENVNRMYLIENLTDFLNYEKNNSVKGVFFFTINAEFMFSNIVDDEVTQFLTKLIENNMESHFNFDNFIIKRNHKFIIVEHIAKSYIVAIMMNENIPIRKSLSISKKLLKKIRTYFITSRIVS